jgi:carbon-monoxide dehydrogenase small subunit
MPKKIIKMVVNGREEIIEINPYDSLLKVLRDYLGLTGAKRGCDYGGCGCCTVVVDGKAVYSCMYPAMKAEGKEIITIEGLYKEGKLHPIQRAFIDANTVQCGYSIPGAIMSAYALLLRNPNPTDEEIKEAFSGNLCRCSAGYYWPQAVKLAIKYMREQEEGKY